MGEWKTLASRSEVLAVLTMNNGKSLKVKVNIL